MNNNKNSIRSNRKLDHIKYALRDKKSKVKTGLDDIVLIHKALPKYDLQDIKINTVFLDKCVSAPIYINAMTGGHYDVTNINKALGTAASIADIPIAVGSQMAAIIDKELIETYSVVRKSNPRGIVLGNISANATPEQAQRAVEMIEADAIQLHLNVAQEIIMHEGDTKFKYTIENIANIKEKLSVPVIVKEVGCGMSKDVITELMKIGVEYIDISGAGGTNFIDIEFSRNNRLMDTSLSDWGIPTAYSMIEARLAGLNGFLVSGGIKNSMDIAKCLSMGASLVGISGEILRKYYNDIDICEWLLDIKSNLKKIMLLTNSCNINSLKCCDKVIKGELLEWEELRKKGN